MKLFTAFSMPKAYMTALPKRKNKASSEKSHQENIQEQIAVVFSYYLRGPLKRDGWIMEHDGAWILRFRYDWESWDQNPKVWVEKGRLQQNGIPLLKNRKRMRRGLAVKLWKNLLTTGWRRINPQWD